MNFKFKYLDYPVTVERFNELHPNKRWSVNVDGVYFCSITKVDGLDFDKNEYRAYTPFGQVHHSGHDDETSIAELVKMTMDWLY